MRSENRGYDSVISNSKGDFHLQKQRQTLSTETLEHLNAQTSKHQLWISHADTILNDNDMKLQLTNQNFMQLNVNVQSCVKRSEMEGQLGVIKGVNKSMYKGMREAIEERVGEGERMQAVIAKEVASVRNGVERGLGIVGEAKVCVLEESELGIAILSRVEKMIEERVGKALEQATTKTSPLNQITDSQIHSDVEQMKRQMAQTQKQCEDGISRLSNKCESNSATITELTTLTAASSNSEVSRKAHLAAMDEASELKEKLKQMQTDMADVQEALQNLSEEVESDRIKAKGGQKTIGAAMVDLKDNVDSVRSIMEEKDKEIDELKEEIKSLKESASGGSVKKIFVDLEKLEKRIGEGSRAERLREAKIAGQMDKISKNVEKVEAAMGEGLEEVGLEMGVLKLKVGDVESSFGGVGGRIRVVEEEITVLKKKVKENQTTGQKSNNNKPAQPPPPNPLDDSFASDDDESVEIMNVKREMGTVSSVPIKKPAAKPEPEEDSSFDFEGITFDISVAIPRPIKSSDFDVVESVFSPQSQNPTKADEAGKAPRQGDRVKARWKGLRNWFKGVCIAVNDKTVEGGGGAITWNVQYDDGVVDKFVKRDFIQLDEEFYEGDDGKKKAGDRKSPEPEKPKETEKETRVDPPRSPIARRASKGMPSGRRSSGSKPDLSEIQKAEMEEEAQALEDSTKMPFPSQIFVMRWSAAQVKSWIVNVVKMPDVADKFYEQKMNGTMIMDRKWTPRDMEHDLSHPTEGMNISNAQKRARVSAFIKALRETDRETRKSRIRNYYAIWKGQDEVGNEEEEMKAL
ncbi:hypothetical protein TL16_g13084 [Triparma laevis f. inornata]|uniref:Uncharacterized protein n=1 Tax=Triparma laevis f. inornata TaxID=1714386 RepID=A0A9W7EYI7_9STRA|nr:hypothetical protein TL16_g13084 [Triparma laevis f. inornata]